ncbi:MAG: 3-phosphoshikimate 1-carboxyvinyltransferase [Propionibacteriaceae bacterium]|nr:3-phosphoshikimate 1-carboxyvinyltransferase [Propionibacteriaceae bacterium]
MGTCAVPGSKSETNRALVLAALADGPATISGALTSRDSDLMIAALRSLGVAIDSPAPGVLRLVPPPRFSSPAQSIDCGLAGTVMRFVPPMAALADGPVAFHGDPHASKRPMAGLLDGLRQLGVTVFGDALPLTVTPGPDGPTCHPGEVVIDASASSQFISGLLLIGARVPGGLRLRHRGSSVPSRPHIEMTVSMLQERGVEITSPDDSSWHVTEGSIAARDVTIEPDLTNAAAFLAAAAVSGGQVTVPGWPARSLQPGAMFLDVAGRMGCEVAVADGAARLVGPERLRAAQIDLHEASELTPVVAALAAVAEGTTRISGVAHIRGHETDRLRALAAELTKLGVTVAELPDGLEITGGLPTGAAVELCTHADHRLAHFAAILALARPQIAVDDIGCVSKTMPDFLDRWTALVGS